MSIESGFKVAVLGGGSFGSVLARILATSVSSQSTLFNPMVSWWVRRKDLANEINTSRTNSHYLGDVCRIPENIAATTDLCKVASDADIIILAVPHEYLDSIYPLLKANVKKTVQLVSAIKGLSMNGSSGNITPLSIQIMQSVGAPVSMLSGPNIYTEMAKDLFAEATLGYFPSNIAAARTLSALFNTNNFYTEIVPDLVGVDMCGALKNCITLTCGLCEGMNLGMNTKAALIRQGHVEIMMFCKSYFDGGENSDVGTIAVNTNTFQLACGLGDLMLSCLVGRGQQLSAEFIRRNCNHCTADAAEEISEEVWLELENSVLNGMKLPDWRNIQVVYYFLEVKDVEAASQGGGEGLVLRNYPLLAATFHICFRRVANPKALLLNALRGPVATSGLPSSPPLV